MALLLNDEFFIKPSGSRPVKPKLPHLASMQLQQLPDFLSDSRERHRHPGLDPGSRLWIPAFEGMTEKTPFPVGLSDSLYLKCKADTIVDSCSNVAYGKVLFHR